MDIGFILVLIILSMIGATCTWRTAASSKSGSVHYKNHKACCKGPNLTELQMAEIKTRILCTDIRMRDHVLEDELDYVTRKKCLTSSQARDLINMISNDLIKYGCARSLVARVYDPNEFYIVANTIHDMDMRLKLKMEIYDYNNSLYTKTIDERAYQGTGLLLAAGGGNHLSFSEFLKKNRHT